MPTERIVTKELGGAEDLTFGTSTVSQVRGSGLQNITQINASHIPLIDAANLIAAGNVEEGLAELIGLINTNIANIASNTGLLASNEALNGSFEFGTTADPTQPEGWVVAEFPLGTVQLDSTNAVHGAQSLRFTSTGTGGGSATTTAIIAVSEDQVVSVSWFLISTIGTVQNEVFIDWKDEAMAIISSSTLYSELVANPTTWTGFSESAVAPSGARFFSLRFEGAGIASVVAGSTNFDGISMSRSGVGSSGTVFATQAEVNTGTNTTSYVSPSTLRGTVATQSVVNSGVDTFRPVSSETLRGVVATQTQVNTGVDAFRTISPLTLRTLVASQAQVDAGVDTFRHVTPLTLENKPVGSIAQSGISTGTISLAGALPPLTIVDITLSPYSFFPMIHHTGNALVNMLGNTIDGADPDSPRFALHNTDAVIIFGYDVDYRFITA